MEFTREFVNDALIDLDAAAQLIRTIAVNLDNDSLSDADFRQFVKNSVPVVMHARRASLTRAST